MACLTTNKIYRFADFEFLTHGELSSTHFLESGPQAIVGTVRSTGGEVGINEAYFDQLLALTERSQVGIGGRTVHNEEIRASNEIPASQVTLHPAFLELIQKAVDQMSLQLWQPTKVRPQLYKVLLYQQGDHFEDHIDNSHTANMIMTLSVELPTSDVTQGGNLVIEGTTVPHPQSGQMGLTLFYQDAKHKVTEVRRGRRITLVFDVVQEPTQLLPVFQPFWDGFQRGIQALRQKGVKRIGFMANHIYLIDSGRPVSVLDLKGTDRIGYELLKYITGESNIFFEEVARDEQRRFYFAAINEILDLEGSFSVAFRSYDPEELDDEERESDTTGGEYPYPVRSTLDLPNVMSYDRIELCRDTSRTYRAVDPKYKMGDVVLLATTGRAQIAFYGDSELHTGNQGFSGEIYTNIGIFANI